MACLFQTIERDGKTLDMLTNEETGFRITVNRIGAELVSLARRNAAGEWVGFLYRDGDVTPAKQGWNNHATVMGYYVHRLVAEKSVYRGEEIRGGTHSFLRHKTFRAPAVSSDAITYSMTQEEYEPHEYPYNVSLKLTYRIVRDLVAVEFAFENHESCNSAHVSFGLHPGFATAAFEQTRVLFPPGYYVRHLAPDNFLSGEQESREFTGGEMPYPKSELLGSFLLELAGVPKREFVFEDPAGGRRVELDYSEAPYLTVWSDGPGFICVEPCWGLPDHHEQRPFEDKLGIHEIQPDESLKAGFSIRCLLI